jgi:hypothetical protein
MLSIAVSTRGVATMSNNSACSQTPVDSVVESPVAAALAVAADRSTSILVSGINIDPPLLDGASIICVKPDSLTTCEPAIERNGDSNDADVTMIRSLLLAIHPDPEYAVTPRLQAHDWQD